MTIFISFLSKELNINEDIIYVITTTGGNCYSWEVDYPKGEPENPMTRFEVEAKYKALTKESNTNNYYQQYGL